MRKPQVDSHTVFGVLLVILGMLIVMQTTRLIFVARDMAWIIKHESVFDIDAMRRQFLNETTYMFMQGCIEGINRPDTPPTSGFDVNSPANYCNTKRERWDEYLLREVGKFGRRERTTYP